VAVGTLYNYFRHRDELLGARVHERRLELLSALDRELAESAGAPFERRLARFIDAILVHFQRHFGLFSILMEAELCSKRGVLSGAMGPQEAFREVQNRIEALLADGVRRGEVRAEGSEIYPALLLGMLRGVLSRQLFRKHSAPVGATAEVLLRVFLDGTRSARP
jgi:AcrR family transcriptional regulator